MSTHSPIPKIYRILFILFDILLPFMGIYLNAFDPIQPLKNYTPTPITPINPETLVLINGFSGFLVALAFLNIFFLLYRPDDVLLWKALVGAVLLQDIFMLGGFAKELNVRDGEWRGADYGNLVGYAAIALLRALFVAGVGVGSPTDARKRA